MFVEALRENGNDYLVEQVAQRMEARGLYELAQRVPDPTTAGIDRWQVLEALPRG